MARRVVGYLEYGRALDTFGELVSMSDEEDLAAYDAIIGTRSEFAVFHTMPEGFDESGGESRNQVANETGLARANVGLSWLVALARLEFGAIVAGFTEHPDPYQYLQPDSFAYTETMQMLLEGAASHYLTLLNDEVQEQYIKENANIQGALTLSRRVRIARAMLRPMMKEERSRYTSNQANQLEKATNDLDTAQANVNSAITKYLSQTNTSEHTETVTSDLLRACGAQLAAERREIQAGTATITRFPTPEASRHGGTTPQQGTGNR